MIELNLSAVGMQVGEFRDPQDKLFRMLVFEDMKSGIKVSIPLDENAVDVLVKGLEGKPVVPIARELPAMAIPRKNGARR